MALGNKYTDIRKARDTRSNIDSLQGWSTFSVLSVDPCVAGLRQDTVTQ